MRRSEVSVLLIGVLLLVTASVQAATTPSSGGGGSSSATESDQQCKKADENKGEVYDSTRPYGKFNANVNGAIVTKMNLYGKTCVDFQNGKGTVSGICVAAQVCKCKTFIDQQGKTQSCASDGKGTTPKQAAGGSTGTAKPGATTPQSGSTQTTPRQKPGDTTSKSSSGTSNFAFYDPELTANKNFTTAPVDKDAAASQAIQDVANGGGIRGNTDMTPAATPEGSQSRSVTTSAVNDSSIGSLPYPSTGSFGQTLDRNGNPITPEETLRQNSTFGSAGDTAAASPCADIMSYACMQSAANRISGAVRYGYDQLFGVSDAEAKPGTVSKGACLSNPGGCLMAYSGEASWYNPALGGINSSGTGRTANGEIPNPHGDTIASQRYPMDTVLQACGDNGCRFVRVNDTGDFDKAKYGYRVADFMQPGPNGKVFPGSTGEVTLTPVGVFSSSAMAREVTAQLNAGSSVDSAIQTARDSTGGRPLYVTGNEPTFAAPASEAQARGYLAYSNPPSWAAAAGDTGQPFTIGGSSPSAAAFTSQQQYPQPSSEPAYNPPAYAYSMSGLSSPSPAPSVTPYSFAEQSSLSSAGSGFGGDSSSYSPRFSPTFGGLVPMEGSFSGGPTPIFAQGSPAAQITGINSGVSAPAFTAQQYYAQPQAPAPALASDYANPAQAYSLGGFGGAGSFYPQLVSTLEPLSTGYANPSQEYRLPENLGGSNISAYGRLDGVPPSVSMGYANPATAYRLPDSLGGSGGSFYPQLDRTLQPLSSVFSNSAYPYRLIESLGGSSGSFVPQLSQTPPLSSGYANSLATYRLPDSFGGSNVSSYGRLDNTPQPLSTGYANPATAYRLPDSLGGSSGSFYPRLGEAPSPLSMGYSNPSAAYRLPESMGGSSGSFTPQLDSLPERAYPSSLYQQMLQVQAPATIPPSSSLWNRYVDVGPVELSAPIEVGAVRAPLPPTRPEDLGQSTSFDRNLGFSSHGADVSALQQRLIDEGYLNLRNGPSGYYGALTQAAVMRYQAARGILQTGFVGPVTRRSLNR